VFIYMFGSHIITWDITDNFSTSLTILHQNIGGLCDKSDELMCPLISNIFTLPFICLTEYYTTIQHILTISLDNYQLFSNFSCTNHIGGAVCTRSHP
jgi:hypothetical protein